MKRGMTQKQDLTLHFAECPHSERVAEDVMADLYPAFVFLLLPLCHLLRYRRLGSLGEVGELPAWPVQRTGGGEEGGGALQSEEPPTAENARTHARELSLQEPGALSHLPCTEQPTGCYVEFSSPVKY